VNKSAVTKYAPRRAARAVLPVALAGLLLAPTPVRAASYAAAGTPHPVVLANASGTALTPTTLLPDLFHVVAPVTVAWKVSPVDTGGIHNAFTVELTDAQGRIRSVLVRTTRAGRASVTTPAACARGCYLKISVTSMDYAIVGYATGAAR
jgi:hypothetical protein